MTVTVNESTFLGFGFESLLWGIYFMLFIAALCTLTWKRKTEHIQTFYLFFCCFLFACCTIHEFIRFRYMYKDLVQARNPLGIIETGTPALRTADALVTLIDFFAELVLTYRLWMIWNRNYYIIILPLLLSFAFVSCAMASIAILVATPTAAIAPPSLLPLGTAAFALPLCFNGIVTGLIIGRIWYKGRQMHKLLHQTGGYIMPTNYVMDAIMVIVESGALYLVTQFVLTTLFAINHPAQIMVSDIAVQIYGIAPTLIFVRVGLGGDEESTLPTSVSDASSRRMPARNRAAGRNGAGGRSTGTDVSLVIPITKTVHRDTPSTFDHKEAVQWEDRDAFEMDARQDSQSPRARNFARD